MPLLQLAAVVVLVVTIQDLLLRPADPVAAQWMDIQEHPEHQDRAMPGVEVPAPLTTDQVVAVVLAQ
jgi:hypothetical protein